MVLKIDWEASGCENRYAKIFTLYPCVATLHTEKDAAACNTYHIYLYSCAAWNSRRTGWGEKQKAACLWRHAAEQLP